MYVYVCMYDSVVPWILEQHDYTYICIIMYLCLGGHPAATRSTGICSGE